MLTDQIIRWGFIGCGEATERRTLPAFSLLPDAKVVAVMSRNIERAKAFAQRHGIRRWYNDAQNLVTDPDVDAVYIATPPSTHATYAVMALNAGKAVYVEKPLATHYDDCIRINRVASAHNLPCFVAYYRRFLPYFQRVKQLLESGVVGNVLAAMLLLLAGAGIISAMNLSAASVAYFSAGVSFLSAFAAAYSACAGKDGRWKCGLLIGLVLTILLLMLGFIVEGRELSADGVLSVVSFTMTGALAGGICFGKAGSRCRKRCF